MWKFLTLLLWAPLWYLALLIPKKKRLWIFGEWNGQTYKDNSKYLFEYAVRQRNGPRCVWISRNEQVLETLARDRAEAYNAGSLRGIWTILRAHTAIISVDIGDIHRGMLAPKRLVQLWHGSPLKKIGADDRFRHIPWRRLLKKILFAGRYGRYDLLLSAGPVVSQCFRSAHPDATQILELGYPRTDALKSIIRPLNCITYLPTHRNFGKEDESFLFDGLDSVAADNWMAARNLCLVIKMHPYYSGSLDHFAGFKHVRFSHPSEDVYELLQKTAVLITDYSSIHFDFLLTRRPIIFAPFDKDTYLTEDRELYFDYDSVTPGPKCESWPVIFDEIEKFLKGRDDFVLERIKVRDRFNLHKDFRSSKRVYDFLLEDE